MADKLKSQAGGIDLASIFNLAAQALAANQSSLNAADTHNQDHGDNMVQAFSMITQALAGRKDASPSDQLMYASQQLAKKGSGGSAHLYSQGLAQASQQFKGQKSVTPDNAMMLIQSLLGGDQQSAQQSGNQAQDGFDLGDLLNAGMSFMNAKKQGQDNLQAGLSALMAAGPMGQNSHRQQSGQLVANVLLQAIAEMSKKK